MNSSNETPFDIRCLKLAQTVREKVVRVWETIESAIAMGLISDNTFRYFDTYPFDETKDIQIDESSLELETWEQHIVDSQFPAQASVLVLAAGGLRELVGLHRQGFATCGIEYGPRLHEVSNAWLNQNQIEERLELASRFEIPDLDTDFDAAFVGRYYYSHIRERMHRVEFLKCIRKQLKENATLVLSYYICEKEATFRIQAKIANTLRKILGRGQDIVEVGDHVDPDSSLYHHHFAGEEVISELTEAGFQCESQEATWFGRAVARIDTSDSKLNSSPFVPDVVESHGVSSMAMPEPTEL